MMKTTTKNLLRCAIMLLMALVSFANVVKAEDFTFDMTLYNAPYKIIVSINEKCVIKIIYQDTGRIYKTRTFKCGQIFGHNTDAVVSFSDKEVAEYEDFNNYDEDSYIVFGIYAISGDEGYCLAHLKRDEEDWYEADAFTPANRETYMRTFFDMRMALNERGATRSSSGKYTRTVKFGGSSTSANGGSTGTNKRSGIKPTTTTTKYVDLGLSVKWATCNLGASSPEQYGNYYAWGETTKKTNYSWDTYKYGKWSDAITKYCQDKAYGKNGYSDRRTTLELTDDAARIRLGTPWRMPTAIEIRELVERCTWTRATIGGKSGYKVVGPNGNSIFLPAGGRYFKTTHGNIGEGYYWSSTLGDYPVDAQYLDFDSTGPHRRYAGSRIHGMLIRPVRP